MEGDGESMLAVVSSPTRAMTVTLLTDHRTPSNYIDSNWKPTSHSSAETNTERNVGTVRVPIYDVRYASSFGFADYRSPFAAFPQHISPTFKTPDLFSQSLRKYPNDGSSAEFIQRIIDYSRSRKSPLSKKHYPKSLRSLLRKTISQTQDANNYNTPNENNERKRRPGLDKDLSQSELVNYTYDYLKSASGAPRDADVRYLTQMKRAIQGKLRCMVDDEPIVCPRMRSRYSHHRRHYHDLNDINQEVKIEETQRNVSNATSTASPAPSVDNDATSNRARCRATCKPCQPSCDWDDRQSEGFFHKSQDAEIKTFVNEIDGWLHNIPVKENFSRNERIRREELTNDLAKTLKSLHKDINFPTLAKKEIKKYLDMLPMWRPGDSEFEVVLEEQVVDDLIKRLTNLAEEDFKTAISEEVKNLPFDTELLKENVIRETIDTFVDKLTAVALRRPEGDEEYKENLKSEVIKIIKELPLETDKQNDQQILRLAEKAVERLHHNNIFKVDNKQKNIDNIKKTVFDWCTEVPELSNHSAEEYADLVQSLADKFHAYEACDIQDVNFVRELREELENWLDNMATRLNTNFNAETKYKLSNKLIERLLSASVIEHVMKWFNNIPDLSIGNSIELNRALKNVAFQLKEILVRNDDLESMRSDMKDIISKWLKHILQAKDIQLDPKDQDNFVNDLIVTLTDVPARKKDQLQSEVVTWLKEIPSIKPYDNFETNNCVRDFVVRLMEIQTESNKDGIEPDIEDEINTFVEQLSKLNDTNIAPDYVDELKSKVLTRVNTLPKDQKCCKQFLIEEISNIVESSAMLSKERKEILKNKILSAILKNITENPIHWDNFFAILVNMVTHETQVNKNDIEAIVNNITEKINDLLIIETEEKLCDRTYTSCKICNNSSKVQKNNKTYLDPSKTQELNSHNYTASTSHNGNLSILKNIDLASQNFDQKIEKRKNVNISQPNTINGAKTFRTIETDNTISKVNEQSFLDNNFSTSTPVNSTLKHPTAAFAGLSANHKTEESFENSAYLNELKNVIRNWLNQFDKTINENEKKIFIDGVASDIMNRQKYLKLSSTCTCDKDELEHLKYQIFKRLNSIVDDKLLHDIILNVSCLYRVISQQLQSNIECKKTNDLTESLSMRFNDTCATGTYIPLQDTSEFVLENLSGAIADWLKTTHYRSKLQNKMQHYLASVLAYDIKHVLANCSCSFGDKLNKLIIKEIIKNLKNITGDIEDSTLCHYACDLLKYLNDLKLFHDISDRKPGNRNHNACSRKCDLDSSLYKYEIKGAVTEWLDNLPLQGCRSMILDVAQNFVESIVNYSDLNILSHENLLKEHTIRFLSKIPLRVNEQGYSGIEDQATALTTMLKDIYVQMKLATADRPKQPRVQEAQDFIYKQLLHDTVSKTFFEKIPTEEQFSLNLLKEKLAYAFIDLYSLSDDVETRIKIKNNLCKEINKFCDAYVKCKYALHLHGDEIQENLHQVLLNVALPIIETNLDIHRDKISVEIRKWIKGKPVCDVMVSILANRIHPILNKTELNNSNIDEIKNEIIKWIQSLQLKSDAVLSLEESTDDLLDNLKVLAKFKNVLTKEWLANNSHISMKDSQYIHQSSNTIRTYETDHLERIGSISTRRTCFNPTLTTCTDIGIQTGINYRISRNVETNTTTISSINKEISPRVIVKEYLWDSTVSKPSCHTLASAPITHERKTIVRTTESQTDSYTKYEMQSHGPCTSKYLFKPRIISECPRQRRPLLKSQHCQASNSILLETPNCQQQLCRPRGNIDCQPHRKMLESDDIHNLDYEYECLSASRQPRRGDRRCYVSPECMNRKSRPDNSCCGWKKSLYSNCRSRLYPGSRRKAVSNNSKHCSKCFGGQCPHPSYFFFKRDL